MPTPLDQLSSTGALTRAGASELADLSKKRGSTSPNNAVDAAKNFESLMVTELLKTMRSTIPENEDGFAMNTVWGMFDDAISKTAAGGLGLAPMLARDLGATEEEVKAMTLLGPSASGKEARLELSAARPSAERTGAPTKSLAASDKPAVIFMHHPPHDTGLATMDRHKLQDGDAFFDAISGAPVSQLICGHVHRTVSGSVRGVPFSIFKSLGAHQFPMICDPIDQWVEVTEPVGYGAVLLTEDSVLVHSEDFETTDIEYALRKEQSAATL